MILPILAECVTVKCTLKGLFTVFTWEVQGTVSGIRSTFVVFHSFGPCGMVNGVTNRSNRAVTVAGNRGNNYFIIFQIKELTVEIVSMRIDLDIILCVQEVVTHFM